MLFTESVDFGRFEASAADSTRSIRKNGPKVLYFTTKPQISERTSREKCNLAMLRAKRYATSARPFGAVVRSKVMCCAAAASLGHFRTCEQHTTFLQFLDRFASTANPRHFTRRTARDFYGAAAGRSAQLTKKRPYNPAQISQPQPKHPLCPKRMTGTVFIRS